PIDFDRFLLFGSITLFAYGIRQCRDIDGLVSGIPENSKTSNFIEKVAEYFYNEKTKFFFASLGIIHSKYWKKEWDIKDKRWLKLMKITHKDQLIFDPNNHFYFNGLKIMTLK